MRVFRWFWKLIISLRFAVIVIAGLALSLATGTILESYYDTHTASYFVYRAIWFKLLLGGLGLNILAVAMSRFPWRRSQTPFLLAHAGILILLTGSWLCQRYGLDGQLRIREGQTGNGVEFEDEVLALSDGRAVDLIEVPWVPPMVEAKPFDIPKYGLRVDRYLTHAEAQIAFRAPEKGESDRGAAPAIHLKIEGGPMQMSQDFWLWSGDPAWSTAPMGPARFVLLPKNMPGPAKMATPGEALLEFWVNSQGEFSYWAVSRRGDVKAGKVSTDRLQGAVIDPDWKGVKITVLDWIPLALNKTHYQRAKYQFGDQAPSSAIRIYAAQSGPDSGIWMGQGDQASVLSGGREVSINYTTRRVILSFGLRLDRFQIDHYEGTMNPSSYSSRVTVMGSSTLPSSGPITISMNEPLKFGGYIFYQSSYIPEMPRSVTTVLSVNYDPGRWLKYLGSLLIVLGSILLFAAKKIRKPKEILIGKSKDKVVT